MYRYKQNKQLSFLVKHDTKIANLKVKAHEKRSVLVRPTEKVSRTSATSGKNESRALLYVRNIFLNGFSFTIRSLTIMM